MSDSPHEGFKRLGAAMAGIRLSIGPMAKLQERYDRYLHHCEALGLSRDDASAILTGVSHVIRQIPYPMDELEEATAAASELATHRAGQALGQSSRAPAVGRTAQQEN